jgi:hypothetical protein
MDIIMVAGKEYLYPLENLSKTQKQIYPDACDYGIISTPEIFETIKKSIDGLKETYKHKILEWGDLPKTGGRTISFFIPFEYDEERYNGVNLDIAYHVDTRRKVKFFSIDIKRDITSINPFLGD